MDRREAILARLETIQAEIDGINKTFRNRGDEITDTDKPASSLYDADETADERLDNDTGKPARSPNKVAMMPEIYLSLAGRPEDVGPAINAMRVKLIKAVLFDDQLKTIVGPNGSIRYQGCATGLARGRNMQADMRLVFTFIYPLIPGEL